MSLSDPIADTLTRIRNAYRGSLEIVGMPYSKLKCDIMRILKREGYIKDYIIDGEKQEKRELRVYLKYTGDNEPAIRGLRRESKPSLRRYVASKKIPRVLGGMGVAVLSTSSGVMTDKDARKQNIGGEFLCSVW